MYVNVVLNDWLKFEDVTFAVAIGWRSDCESIWQCRRVQGGTHQTWANLIISDNVHISYNSVQFSAETANFMAPPWPRPLTFVRPFNNFSWLRPLEQPQWVLQELDQWCRRSVLKYILDKCAKMAKTAQNGGFAVAPPSGWFSRNF